MEAEAEILQPFELHFSDLLLLSSDRVSSPSPEELERLESISGRVMEALGPSGPGLLCVTGVPKASALRGTLLPLARKLALLSNNDRVRILKDHGLGSDVSLKNLDRTVSSFALQLKYVQDPGLELSSSELKHEHEDNHIAEENTIEDSLHDFLDFEFKKLGNTFKELGFCMMDLGLRLAQLCGKAIGSREIEHSILDSCTAKGRLIHYHSILDNRILKETKRRRTITSRKRPAAAFLPLLPHGSTALGDKIFLNSASRLQDEQTISEHLNRETETIGIGCCRTSISELWQQWHYDYGIFTVLTTPMFMSSCDTPIAEVKDCSCTSSNRECSPPDGHTYLQLFDTTRNKILVVKSHPESFIIQVGESADILSHGKLCATLHSVCRPVGLDNLSRETFVVFLQPAWGKTLSISERLLTADKRKEVTSNKGINGAHNEENRSSSQTVQAQDSRHLMEKIFEIVPPLSTRLRDGMTFAEFSRETTKQYYGGSGTQSRR